MTVYTVHEPQPKNQDTVPPERIRFVRDGFYVWAFLLGPIWMLWHRLWRALLLYVVGMAALLFGLAAIDAPDEVTTVALFLVALLVGLEGGTLRRWSLARWRERGIVVAPDLETAERRFFGSEAAYEPPPPPASRPPASATHLPTSDADIIGLFPDPEPRR